MIPLADSDGKAELMAFQPHAHQTERNGHATQLQTSHPVHPAPGHAPAAPGRAGGSEGLCGEQGQGGVKQGERGPGAALTCIFLSHV